MPVTAIRLLIHGWELPSFPKDSLRNETRRALRHVLERGIPGLAKVTIDFDDLRPQRPRDPEELSTWTSPIREAIDLEIKGTGSEDDQLQAGDQIRYRISQLTMFVLRRYIEANAWNVYRKRAVKRYIAGEIDSYRIPKDDDPNAFSIN